MKALLLAMVVAVGFTFHAQADAPANPAPPAAPAAGGAPTTDPAADKALAKIGADAKALTDAEQTHNLGVIRTAVPAVRADAAAFVQKFPNDPRAADARLLQAQADQMALGLSLEGAPSRDVVLAEFRALATDPSAPTEIRVRASMIDAQQIFMSVMDQAKDNPHNQAMWDDLDKKIEAFGKTTGPAAGQDPPEALVMLRHNQISLLEQAGETARVQALLAKLKQSPDPQMASMAKDAATEVQEAADLKSKPLDLKFTAFDGREVDLSKLRGKIVLLDFWATWCPPCVAETPNVVAAYTKYHDKGFEIVGISLDQSKGALQKYVADNKMPWPQYFDGKGWDSAVGTRFGIDSIPAMWLIGKDGVIATQDGRDDLDGQIGKLLGGK
jgi:thiol-disulfide isomerase/thioredoxin